VNKIGIEKMESTTKAHSTVLSQRLQKLQLIVDEMESERDYALHMGCRGFTEYEDSLFERLQEELENTQEEAESGDGC
jgi:hypothetical protein